MTKLSKRFRQQDQTITICRGTRSVVASRYDGTYSWTGRLYVNGGETPTLTVATRKTEAGMRLRTGKSSRRHSAAFTGSSTLTSR